MKNNKSSYHGTKYKCQVTFFPYQHSFPFSLQINEHHLTLKTSTTNKDELSLIQNLLLQIYPLYSNKTNSFCIHYSIIKSVKYNSKTLKYQFNLFNPASKNQKDIIIFIHKLENTSTFFSKMNSNEKNLQLLQYLHKSIIKETKEMINKFDSFFQFLKDTLDAIGEYTFMIDLDVYDSSKAFYEKCLKELKKSSKKNFKKDNEITTIKNRLLIFDSLYNELTEKANDSIAMTILFIFDFFEQKIFKRISFKNEFTENINYQNKSLRSNKSSTNIKGSIFDTQSNYSENLIMGTVSAISLNKRKRHNSNGSNSTNASDENNVETPRFNKDKTKSELDLILCEKNKHGFLPSYSISNIEINTEEFIHRKFFEKEFESYFDKLFYNEKDNYNLIKLDSFYDYLSFLKQFYLALNQNKKEAIKSNFINKI